MDARTLARIRDLTADYEQAETLAKNGKLSAARALIEDLDNLRAEWGFCDRMFTDDHGEFFTNSDYPKMSVQSFAAHAYAGCYQA